MPSGYEKSPDYGSPPPLPPKVHLILAIIIGIIVIGVWRNWPEKKPPCRVVRAADVAEVKGDKATMRLDKVVPRDGSCLTVVP